MCLKHTNCKQCIKTKWRLIVWSVEEMQKISTKKWLEQQQQKRLVMQSKCSVCGIIKSRFVKEQEAKDLLSNLGIRTPLSKIPLLNVLI